MTSELCIWLLFSFFQLISYHCMHEKHVYTINKHVFLFHSWRKCMQSVINGSHEEVGTSMVLNYGQFRFSTLFKWLLCYFHHKHTYDDSDIFKVSLVLIINGGLPFIIALTIIPLAIFSNICIYSPTAWRNQISGIQSAFFKSHRISKYGLYFGS